MKIDFVLVLLFLSLNIYIILLFKYLITWSECDPNTQRKLILETSLINLKLEMRLICMNK